MFGLRDEDIRIITSLFQTYSEIEKVILFGSRAMGNYKPGSDIDLALLGPYVTDVLASTIHIALNEYTSLPYKFDVVAYTKDLETSLKNHIDEHGKIFYQKTRVT